MLRRFLTRCMWSMEANSCIYHYVVWRGHHSSQQTTRNIKQREGGGDKIFCALRKRGLVKENIEKLRNSVQNRNSVDYEPKGKY